MEVKKLSIEEWISLTQGEEKTGIPITLTSVSGSMQPAVRPSLDRVIAVPCTEKEVHPGDIVLVRSEASCAGFLLHRLYRCGDGKLLTIGDNRKEPDREAYCGDLLGRAVMITGPGKQINCDSRLRKLEGKLIVGTWRLRPAVFFVRRAFRKLRRIMRHPGAE